MLVLDLRSCRKCDGGRMTGSDAGESECDNGEMGGVSLPPDSRLVSSTFRPSGIRSRPVERSSWISRWARRGERAVMVGTKGTMTASLVYEAAIVRRDVSALSRVDTLICFNALPSCEYARDVEPSRP